MIVKYTILFQRRESYWAPLGWDSSCKVNMFIHADIYCRTLCKINGLWLLVKMLFFSSCENIKRSYRLWANIFLKQNFWSWEALLSKSHTHLCQLFDFKLSNKTCPKTFGLPCIIYLNAYKVSIRCLTLFRWVFLTISLILQHQSFQPLSY